MRAAILARLTSQVFAIPKWYQPFEASAETPKPYGVIKVGTKTGGGGSILGAFRTVQIWPYFDREAATYEDVDLAVFQIVAALKNVTLLSSLGNQFTLEYVSDGPDFRDDVLDAITRPITFSVPCLA